MKQKHYNIQTCNNNKCISNEPNPSMTIQECVRLKLKALYMKHNNNTQPKLIMHYLSHSIPPLPCIHICTLMHSHIHTVLQPLATLLDQHTRELIGTQNM